MKASQGGWAVIESLRTVGYDIGRLPDGAALAESVAPRLRPRDSVLFQNAWTVIPRRQLRMLMAEESVKRQVRESGRRAVAFVNARRARKLVALTEYMADLVRQRTGRVAAVIPVGTSLDLFESVEQEPSALRGVQSFALIPGSVQSYKRPEFAIRYVAESIGREGISTLLFAGLRPDSSLESRLEALASRVRMKVVFVTLTRPEILWAYRRSSITLLPSGLESLGFGLGEALYFSPRVAASPIPAHLEVASRLGAEPMWMFAEQRGALSRPTLAPEDLRDSWRRLGQEIFG